MKKRFNDFIKRYVIAPQPDFKGLSGGKGILLIRMVGFVLWLLFPFLSFILGELICFADTDGAFFGAWSHLTALFSDKPGAVLCGLSLLYLLSLIISLLSKRLWVSCAVIGSLGFCLSTASFFKYQVTGEYFYPWDLAQTGNVGVLSEYINTAVPPIVIISALAVITVTVAVALSKVSIPLMWYLRSSLVLILAAITVVTCSSQNTAEAFIGSFGMSFDEVYAGVDNYEKNGFYTALALNILSESVKSPEEYSESTIDGIMKDYTGKAERDDFASPNVIVILQESFWDLRRLEGCSFSTDPLENFDRITAKDGVYSGTMISPAFGGGTVHPEFELLTGLSSNYLPSGAIPYQYINRSLESYPQILGDLGYSTVAAHPYLSTFYSRDEKYPYLGFDEVLFNDDLKKIEEVDKYNRGGFTSDDSFVAYVEYFIEKTESPLFLFGISMEGHQPYENKFNEDELEIHVTCHDFDPELENTVSQYAQCLLDADRSLRRLTEYVDSLEEDTLLVVFGDHAPSLGSDKAAYRQSGFISSEGLNGIDMEKILSTPFFIYSNFETHTSTMLKAGNDNLISPYNVLNAAFELIGAPETALMEFLKDYYAVCPAYNVKLEGERSPIAERFIKSHEFISHDRLRGAGYSLAK